MVHCRQRATVDAPSQRRFTAAHVHAASTPPRQARPGRWRRVSALPVRAGPECSAGTPRPGGDQPDRGDASNSEAMDSKITYNASGTPGVRTGHCRSRWRRRVIGAWNVHAAIRHRLDGSTVKGQRRRRSVPSGNAGRWVMRARPGSANPPRCPTSAIVAMSHSSQLGLCPALVLRCRLRAVDPPPVKELVPQPRDGYALLP